MGPHSFKCGKQICRTDCRPSSPSFNGAALFQVRKGPSCTPGANPGSPSFNGAALFQVRKASRGDMRGKQSAARFNGAALFQVRKGTTTSTERWGGTWLQWGRTLSSAERLDAALILDRRRHASMGPHSFKCGKDANHRDISDAVLCASMGPHSFKCGKYFSH